MGLPSLTARYELLTLLKTFDTFQVWKARDRLLHRLVVIKGVFDAPDSPRGQNILNEYERLRRCTHPMVVRALTAGVASAPPPPGDGLTRPPDTQAELPFTYSVQQWLEGESLQALAGKLTLSEVLTWLRECLQLVASLHAADLTRLDLKSVHFIRVAGCWQLIDLDQASIDDLFTQQELHGSVAYLAPEALLGRSSDFRADLYSVGVLLYEALTGTLPELKGNSLNAVAYWLKVAPIPTVPPERFPDDPALFEKVTRLMTDLLARTPEARPRSATEALERLELFFPSPDRLLPSPQSPLVGREQALKQLEALIQQHDRSGGCIRISGLSGSGLSRMLEEVMLQQQRQGHALLVLEPETPAAPPLAGLQTLIGWLHTLVPDTAGQPLGPPAGAWHPRPERPNAPALSPSEAQTQAQSQTQPLELLLQAAREAHRCLGYAPRVLVEWPSESPSESLRALQRIAPLLHDVGLLLIVAAPTTVGRSETFGTDETTVLLPPLTAQPVQALAAHLVGPGQLTALELETLARETGGLVRTIHEALELKRWGAAIPLLERAETRERALRSKLLRGLSPQAQLAAYVASVLPMPFSPTLVTQICHSLGMPLDELASEPSASPGGSDDWWQELSRHRLLQPLPSPSSTLLLHFAHEPWRLALNAGLVGTPGMGEALDAGHDGTGAGFPLQLDRRSVYMTAAEHLEEWLAQPPSPESSEGSDSQGLPSHPAPALPAHARMNEVLGHLYLEAGHLLLAQKRLAEAANQAEQEGRLADAVGLLKAQLKATLPSAPARARLLLRLGQLEHRLGAYPSALEWLQKGCNFPRLSPELKVLLDAQRGMTLINLERTSEAALALQQALESEPARRVLPAERVEWHFRLAEAYLRLKRPDQAGEQLDLADALGVPAHSRLSCDQVYYRIWVQSTQKLQGTEARRSWLQALTQAAELARQRGAIPEEDKLLSLKARLLQESRDFAAARQVLEEQVARAVTLLEPVREAAARLNLVSVLETLGDQKARYHHLTRAASLFQNTGNKQKEAWMRLDLADLMLDLGDPHRSAQALARLDLLMQSPLPDAQALKKQLPGVLAKREKLLARDKGTELPAPEVVPQAPEPSSPVNPETARPGPTAPAGENAGAKTPILQESPSSEFWIRQFRTLMMPPSDDSILAYQLAAFVGALFNARACIVLFTKTGLEVMGQSGVESAEQHQLSRGIVQRVRESGKEEYWPDVSANLALVGFASLQKREVEAVIGWPLKQGPTLRGVLYLDQRRGQSASSSLGQPGVKQLVASVAQLIGELLASRNSEPALILHDVPEIKTLVGNSPAMRKLRSDLHQAARVLSPKASTLILGERGTGKNLSARALHALSRRLAGPFKICNCTAIPSALTESVLFGHVKGAFTGALKDKKGLMLLAKGGSLFLDEVGRMPLELQAKLLTVLSERKFSPVGSDEIHELELDAQLILTSNLELDKQVTNEQMLVDFADRIRMNVIRVPSLRERGREDILMLVQAQVNELRAYYQLEPVHELTQLFEPNALSFLQRYDWPGNVRELVNACLSYQVAIPLLDGIPVRRQNLEEALDLPARQTLRSDAPTNIPNQPLPPPPPQPATPAPTAPTHQARQPPVPDMATPPNTLPGNITHPRPLDAAELACFLPTTLTFDELEAYTKKLTESYLISRAATVQNNVSELARVMERGRDLLYRHAPALKRPQKDAPKKTPAKEHQKKSTGKKTPEKEHED